MRFCYCSMHLLLILLLPLCEGFGYVPVVFWTNIRNKDCPSPDVPVIPAEYILKLSESKYFKCLEQSKPTSIKVFVTDELDQSDFSLVREEGGDTKAFAHLQSTLTPSSSVVMPAVQPSSIATFLTTTLKKSFAGAKISVTSLPSIDRSSLSETRKSVAILDETMHEEMLKMSPEDQYIAVLTADAAPQRTPRSATGAYVGRQLLSTKDDSASNNGTIFMHSECVYIAYKRLTLTYQKEVWNMTDANVTNSFCNETSDNGTIIGNTANITLSFTALNSTGKNRKDMSLRLSFTRKKSPVSLDTWWKIASAVLTHDLNLTSTDSSYNLKIADHYSYTAPNKWSWVCEIPDAMTWTNNDKDHPVVQKLQFQTLQIQSFEITNSSFSRALDCSGFLTGPIWMGTVVAILLAVIFAFGMASLASITTMDRFDDPRGKTISVPAHEAK